MNEFIQPKQPKLPTLTPHMEMLIKQEAVDHVFANQPRDTRVDTEPLYQAASLYDYLEGYEAPDDEEHIYEVLWGDIGMAIVPWERFEGQDFDVIISLMIEKREQLEQFAKEIIAAHIGNY